MTNQEREWFKQLNTKRSEDAKTFNHLDYIGIWHTIIQGIYSEQAHFVYELLQNAEDVKATSARFVLKKHGLYFIHNGTVHFTISDVRNENENGHINAITAIGRTGKKISDSIGKFGIGFKAVFQYTLEPHIFDPIFKFKISNYIIPILLENYKLLDDDIKYDENTETVFYFPFCDNNNQNGKMKNKEDAYSDIKSKFVSLNRPNIFLYNLKEISWKYDQSKNTYKKEIVNEKNYGEIQFKKLVLYPSKKHYLFFNRSLKLQFSTVDLNYNYSIAIAIEMENNILNSIKENNERVLIKR